MPSSWSSEVTSAWRRTLIGFGERIPAGKQPYHDSLAFYRRHPGWSFMGKMVWDTGRAIDFLETLPMVDPKRIGSIGHSHGAYETLFATAFEPRITAAVASCGFTTFRSDPNPERWSHLTALIPQLGFYLPDVARIPFDWQHVLALAAPRPLFVWYATQDAIFPHTDNLADLLKDVQRVYRLQGAADALTWQAFQGPHKFPQAGREQAYRWLESAFARDAAAAAPSGASSNAAPAVTNAPRGKAASAFFPAVLVAHAQANARGQSWAAAIRDSLVAEAKPWMGLHRRSALEPHVRQHHPPVLAGLVGRLLPRLPEARADVRMESRTRSTSRGSCAVPSARSCFRRMTSSSSISPG